MARRTTRRYDACPFASLYINDQQNTSPKRATKNEIPLFITSRGISYLMQRIEEDFGGFFKSDAMLQHVAPGFVLIPLKPDVLKLVFDVQLIAFPYYSSNPAARMAGHHGFGQRKAAGTAGLAEALAPSVAGIGAAGYDRAIELHPAGRGKN